MEFGRLDSVLPFLIFILCFVEFHGMFPNAIQRGIFLRTFGKRSYRGLVVF